MKEITDFYAERAAACNLPDDALPTVLRTPVSLLPEPDFISFTRSNEATDEAALDKYKEVIQEVGVFAVGCAHGEWPVTVGKGRQKAARHIIDLLDPQPNKSARNGQGRTGRVHNLALHALRFSDIPRDMLPETNAHRWPVTNELPLETGAVLLALTGEHVSNGRFQRAVGRLLLVTANNTELRPDATQYVVHVRPFTAANPEFGDQLLRLRAPGAGVVPAV